MSKESQAIDPAGRCVHDRIGRVDLDGEYKNKWLCCDCKEEFYNLDWTATSGKITVMEPYKTLRDEFAMAALQGDWASQSELTGEITDKMSAENDAWFLMRARVYYVMADAMLEARK